MALVNETEALTCRRLPESNTECRGQIDHHKRHLDRSMILDGPLFKCTSRLKPFYNKDNLFALGYT